jgi:cold shock CspA family protein
MAVETKTFSINQPSVSLNEGDKLTFKLVLKGATTNNFTASITEGSLVVNSLAASTGYSSTTCPYFSSSSISASYAKGENNVITFNTAISNFHEDQNYIFVPNPLTGSENSLYSIYGDVDYKFTTKPYDIIISYLSDNTYVESRITSVSKSGSLLQLTLDTPLSNLYRDNLISGSFQRFLVLSRLEDETNTNLIFKKREGVTSYGFIIPQNIAPDVLANIDTITREAKQKLFSDQSIINNINGGGF